MPTTEPTLPTLHDFLAEPLRVGEPDVCGALAVFPIFGPPRIAEYVAFADGVARGMVVKELDGGASVNDLLVLNPTDVNVLLYEGEEVLGAQQNRTFDVSVLVPAGMSLRVPVSCVEHGRWDGGRHHQSFVPAPQAAYPSLRRMKNVAAHARVAAGLDARAEQGAVWDEVAAKSTRMDVESSIGAMRVAAHVVRVRHVGQRPAGSSSPRRSRMPGATPAPRPSATRPDTRLQRDRSRAAPCRWQCMPTTVGEPGDTGAAAGLNRHHPVG
jgi:hypothetical protein